MIRPLSRASAASAPASLAAAGNGASVPEDAASARGQSPLLFPFVSKPNRVAGATGHASKEAARAPRTAPARPHRKVPPSGKYPGRVPATSLVRPAPGGMLPAGPMPSLLPLELREAGAGTTSDIAALDGRDDTARSPASSAWSIDDGQPRLGESGYLPIFQNFPRGGRKPLGGARKGGGGTRKARTTMADAVAGPARTSATLGRNLPHTRQSVARHQRPLAELSADL